MSITSERPPQDSAAAVTLLDPGGLSASAPPEIETIEAAPQTATVEAAPQQTTTLAALPLGAHLVVCCRKDWRTATVVRIELEKITLSVSSPTGRTYRLRRPPDAPLTFHGSIPLLGKDASSCWRTGLARYDVRW